MRVGIVPTKYGYTAVGLPPYDENMNIESVKYMSREMKIQLRGQILQELARYCHDFRSFQNRLGLTFLWALWSFAALATTSLWEAGLKYAVLYGWIRFFFFADGIWLLGQTLRQLRHLRQIKKIANTMHSFGMNEEDLRAPKLLALPEEVTEREFIQAAMEVYPEFEDYYNEMLRVEEPMVFRYWPLGLSGLAKRLFLGPKMVGPRLVFDLGKLE